MNENIKASVRIRFNPREWEFHKMHKQVGSRSFITDFMGNMVESYSLGDWSRSLTEIIRYLKLDKHTDHVFSFWLNGGENDRYQEMCKLEIMFDEDYENRYTYNLNRNFIKYEMHYKGWYLYEIPFNTGDSGLVRLSFACMDAPCTIIPAREKSFYENLQPDEPNTDLPQRSNLVYPKGYPTNASWSWKVFGKESELRDAAPPLWDFKNGMLSQINFNDLFQEAVEDAVEDAVAQLEGRLSEAFSDERITEAIKQGIEKQLQSALTK